MYTTVGTIVNTHGIRGGVKVFPHTDDLQRFQLLEVVYLGKEKRPVYISHVQYAKQMVILTFKEFDSINMILPYKGQDIFIRDEDRLALSKDRYYISDLIGMTVCDESGKVLGTLTSVYEGMANDAYVVSNERGQGMIPAVKEHVIAVNVEEKKMIVHPSEGMIP